MRPIAFMRLRQADDPDELLKRYESRELLVEQKFDGFKVMASRDRSGTKLHSRNGIDLTARAPELVARLDKLLKPGDTVLGEVIYVKGNKQDLKSVQSILHSKDPKRAIRKTKELGGKLQYVVYDLIEERGTEIANEPLSYRRAKLEKRIPSRGQIRLSKTYPWSKRNVAMQRALATGGEGIVIKVKKSPYRYRRRGASESHGEWWKHKAKGKKAQTADVILKGYVRREKRLAFKMYQVNVAGKREYVGNISNLPRATEKLVKRENDRDRPVLAEISFQERFPSGKFRHPGWIRLRPDKPLKSATMSASKMRNPRQGRRAKPYSVWVVYDGPNRIYLKTFSSKDYVSPVMAAREFQLEAGEGARLFEDEKQLHRFLKKDRRRVTAPAVSRRKNPRPSKIKDALAKEATRHKDFAAFARSYWDDCARGHYWIATNEKRFYIGDVERKFIEQGRFTVACNPELALSGKDVDKKYVAELDVTRVPKSDIRIKRGADGTEIKIVGGASSIKVTRVLEASKARRSFKWQLSILPSSKEELRKFWKAAWDKHEKRAARLALQKRKKKEREAVREVKKEREERAASERRKKAAAKKAKKEAAEKKREKAAAKKVERKREAAKKAKKKVKKGKWARVPVSPKKNPGKKTRVRKIAPSVNNPSIA